MSEEKRTVNIGAGVSLALLTLVLMAPWLAGMYCLMKMVGLYG